MFDTKYLIRVKTEFASFTSCVHIMLITLPNSFDDELDHCFEFLLLHFNYTANPLTVDNVA